MKPSLTLGKSCDTCTHTNAHMYVCICALEKDSTVCNRYWCVKTHTFVEPFINTTQKKKRSVLTFTSFLHRNFSPLRPCLLLCPFINLHYQCSHEEFAYVNFFGGGACPLIVSVCYRTSPSHVHIFLTWSTLRESPRKTWRKPFFLFS